MFLANNSPVFFRFFGLPHTSILFTRSLTITYMQNDNPFGSETRSNTLKDLLNSGLVRRITVIEGSYPTDKEQRAFVQRIMDLLRNDRKQ